MAVGSSDTGMLPLFVSDRPSRPIAWRRGAPVSLAEFQSHVAAVIARLPAGTASMINLCEDRYGFLVAYAAALSAGHTVLLPSSRAEQVVADVQNANAGSYRIDDAAVEIALGSASAQQPINTAIPAGMTVMVGYTSGSTGQPKTFPKRWRSVNGSNSRNAGEIRAAIGGNPQTVWLLATVPPQHMYGMELSILLPLSGDMAVHAGRPLFPADIASALAELPRPRVLVSTPVHLRAIVDSPQAFPEVDAIVSATAPLDQPLAAAVEAKLKGEMVEMFGSTETCVFASRRTAREPEWRLYDGVRLESHPEGTLVHAPWFAEPILLQDIVEQRTHPLVAHRQGPGAPQPVLGEVPLRVIRGQAERVHVHVVGSAALACHVLLRQRGDAALGRRQAGPRRRPAAAASRRARGTRDPRPPSTPAPLFRDHAYCLAFCRLIFGWCIPRHQLCVVEAGDDPVPVGGQRQWRPGRVA